MTQLVEHAPVARRVVRRGRALAEALFSSESGPVPAERLDWLEAELTSFLGHAGAWSRFLFGACSFIVYFVGPLLAGKMRSLGSLSLAERIAVFQRLERGALSPTLLACKAILCILYLEHPDVFAEMRS